MISSAIRRTGHGLSRGASGVSPGGCGVLTSTSALRSVYDDACIARYEQWLQSRGNFIYMQAVTEKPEGMMILMNWQWGLNPFGFVASTLVDESAFACSLPDVVLRVSPDVCGN